MTAGAARREAPIVVDGWTLYAHPLFLDQMEALIEEVGQRKSRDPDTYRKKNCTKRLAAIARLILRDIPADPAGAQFRQGGKLGSSRKHWFRAKFFQQYRLFFRFDSTSRIIVFGWVNDEGTKRAYDARSDAYAVFAAMLESGNPPDDFDALLKAARSAATRFAAAAEAVADE